MSTPDGVVGVMHARSARWFRTRIGGLVTERSSRFHAVCERRRKDEAAEADRIVTVEQPGDEDY